MVEVTTLANSGPGSLRAALQSSGPRTVVFRVAGTIDVTTPIVINDPFLTVAGQTAPGGGICLSGRSTGTTPLFIATHDVVLRYLRIRAGGSASGPFKDAVALGEGFGPVSRVVLDHCSLSWSNDETFSIWSDVDPARDVTVQWSLISEGLTSAGQSRALIVGSNTLCEQMSGFSAHHNAFVHNGGRSPYVKIRDTRIVNNVIYNWGVLATQLAGGIEADVVGNLYLPGPDSDGRSEIVLRMSVPWLGCNWGVPGNPSLYVRGNVGPGQPDPDGEQWESMCELVGNGSGWGWPGSPPMKTSIPADWERFEPRAPARFPITLDAAESLEGLLAPSVGAYRRLDADGAWVPARDAADERVIDEWLNGTGFIPNSEQQVGGFPALAAGVPYPDQDNDGMSDTWELANGFDPAKPKDGERDRDRDGYTNLEGFLNGTAP